MILKLFTGKALNLPPKFAKIIYICPLFIVEVKFMLSLQKLARFALIDEHKGRLEYVGLYDQFFLLNIVHK